MQCSLALSPAGLQALDTALAMVYLHSFQPPIVHRDLRSPNILIGADWVAKVRLTGRRLEAGWLPVFVHQRSGRPLLCAPQSQGCAGPVCAGLRFWGFESHPCRRPFQEQHRAVRDKPKVAGWLAGRPAGELLGGIVAAWQTVKYREKPGSLDPVAGSSDASMPFAKPHAVQACFCSGVVAGGWLPKCSLEPGTHLPR